MTRTIFFSWQADTPNGIGRTFLRSALEETCGIVASDSILNEAERDLSIDSDTQGIAGHPPIAATILNKIDQAAVLVADMTFTGKRLDERPTPNPNVLIEYGWALKALGSERVIYVMNDAYGKPGRDSLPFDLAHLRFPMTYTLADGANPQQKAQEKQKLIKKLEIAIRASLSTIRTSTKPEPIFPAVVAKDGTARFRNAGEELGTEEDFRDHTIIRRILLDSGPAMWLRLIPNIQLKNKWITSKLKQIAMDSNYLHPLYAPSGGYSYLQASDGIGMYRVPPEQTDSEISTGSVAFVFRTGEIWAIDTYRLEFSHNNIPVTDIERCFVKGLENYRLFLQKLDIKGPYRWEAGLIGVNGYSLSYPPPPGKAWFRESGPLCMNDEIKSSGLVDFEEPATSTLLPLFENIFAECGIERPIYLSQ